MLAIKPLLKPYSEIVETASRLMGISMPEAEMEMNARLRKLKISKMTVVIYVNWASHNTLSCKEVAKATGLTKTLVRSHLQVLRKKFPWLFSFGPRPCHGAWKRGRKKQNMTLEDAEDMDIRIKKVW